MLEARRHYAMPHTDERLVSRQASYPGKCFFIYNVAHNHRGRQVALQRACRTEPPGLARKSLRDADLIYFFEALKTLWKFSMTSSAQIRNSYYVVEGGFFAV